MIRYHAASRIPVGLAVDAGVLERRDLGDGQAGGGGAEAEG
jgi:hypothetical protein